MPPPTSILLAELPVVTVACILFLVTLARRRPSPDPGAPDVAIASIEFVAKLLHTLWIVLPSRPTW